MNKFHNLFFFNIKSETSFTPDGIQTPRERKPTKKATSLRGKRVISHVDTCYHLIGTTRSNSAVAHDRHHDITEKVKPPFTKRESKNRKRERERERISQKHFANSSLTHLTAKDCFSLLLPRSSDSLSLLKLQPWWAPFSLISLIFTSLYSFFFLFCLILISHACRCDFSTYMVWICIMHLLWSRSFELFCSDLLRIGFGWFEFR